MRLAPLLPFLLLLQACGSECPKSDRTGTYEKRYIHVSGGNCFNPNEVVTGEYKDGQPSDLGGCTIEDDGWSEGDCDYERTMECDGVVGANVRIVEKESTTSNSDGSVWTGTMEHERIFNGSSTCFATYDVTYTRVAD